MRNCAYIVYFTMVYLLKNCSPECTHYYLVLNEYFEKDVIKERIEPTSMKTISLDHPSFNKTKEFQELQENKDCIFEFKNTPTCQLNSTTSCPKQIKPAEGIEVHGTTVYSDTTTVDPETTTVDPETTTVDSETTTVDSETTTVDYETTTVDSEFNESAALASTNDEKEVVKVIGIAAAGATGTAALGYFITMKIKHMLQYGAYHLP